MIDLIEKTLDLDWEVIEDTSNHEYQIQKYTVNGTLYDFSFCAKSAKEFLDAVNEELRSFNTDEYVSDLIKKIENGLDCDMTTEEEMEADAEDAKTILSELATALNIVFELTEIYFPVCEKLDWSYYLSDGYNSVELEKQSPAGEDFGFCVSADKFVDEIVEYAAYFDQEEHVKMFIDAKAHGFAGVPSIRELVDDAKAIDDMLRELACALQNARDSIKTGEKATSDEDIESDSSENEDEKQIIIEFCPHCENEIEMVWNIAERGYQAYCPICGNRLMLCDECQNGEHPCLCDFSSETDCCCRRKPKIVEATFVSMWDFNLQIEAKCKVDLNAKKVFDIQFKEGDKKFFDPLNTNYVLLPDGTEHLAFHALTDDEEWDPKTCFWFN